MATPEMLIAFAVPMFLVAKEPVVDPVLMLTTSPFSMPTSDAEPNCKMDVALVVAL